MIENFNDLEKIKKGHFRIEDNKLKIKLRYYLEVHINRIGENFKVSLVMNKTEPPSEPNWVLISENEYNLANTIHRVRELTKNSTRHEGTIYLGNSDYIGVN